MKGADEVIVTSWTTCSEQVRQSLTEQRAAASGVLVDSSSRHDLSPQSLTSRRRILARESGELAASSKETSAAGRPPSDSRASVAAAAGIAFSFIAATFIFCAPFDEGSGSVDARLLIVLSAFVPLGAVAFYGARTRNTYEITRFGIVYAFTFLLACAGISGITFGPTIVGGDSLDGRKRCAIRAGQEFVLLIFGLMLERTSLQLRSTSVLAREQEQSVIDSKLETDQDRRADDGPSKDRSSSIAASSSSSSSALVIEDFGHVLSWLQALTVGVIVMDMTVNGGPRARPSLTCAMAFAALLPILQEILLYSPNGCHSSKLLCSTYGIVAGCAAGAQFLAGLILPLVRLGFVLVAKVRNVRGQPASGSSDSSTDDFSRAPHWLRELCGGGGGVSELGSSEVDDNDCAALAIRTYLAILISVAVCAYSAYYFFTLCRSRRSRYSRTKVLA